MIILWLIGWGFTLGFISEKISPVVVFGAIFIWPIMLGNDIRELLENK